MKKTKLMKSEKLNERLFYKERFDDFFCCVVLPSKNSNIENIFKADVLKQKVYNTK